MKYKNFQIESQKSKLCVVWTVQIVQHQFSFCVNEQNSSFVLGGAFELKTEPPQL